MLSKSLDFQAGRSNSNSNQLDASSMESVQEFKNHLRNLNSIGLGEKQLEPASAPSSTSTTSASVGGVAVNASNNSLSHHQQQHQLQHQKFIQVPETYFAEDRLLLRFLMARGMDLQKATTMLLNAIEWREETIMAEEIIKDFSYPEAATVDEIYPRYFHKTDRQGRALLINVMGKLDMNKLLAVTSHERFMTEHVRSIEKISKYRLPACHKKTNYAQGAGQLFNIVDLKGAPLMLFPQAQSIISAIARIDSDYYPETLGCMCIINAPLIFTAIWSVIKRFLDAKTITKIHILGTNYQGELKRLIDPVNLPRQYGGTCECVGGCEHSDVGPWNDGSVEGFPQAFWEDFKYRDGLAVRPTSSPVDLDLESLNVEDSSTLAPAPLAEETEAYGIGEAYGGEELDTVSKSLNKTPIITEAPTRTSFGQESESEFFDCE